MKKESIGNIAEKLIHVLVWAFLFGSPLLMMDRSASGVNWLDVVHRIGGPLALFILFYVNYFFLVPELFLNNKKKYFVAANFVLCIVLCFGLIYYERITSTTNRHPAPPLSEMFQLGPNPQQMEHRHPRNDKGNLQLPPPEMDPEMEAAQEFKKGKQQDSIQEVRKVFQEKRKHPDKKFLGIRFPIIFLLRDFLMQILCIILAVTTRMSKRWLQSERALQAAEFGRTEAELKNLRSQINPHFLLNTLNNIYALIMFDQEKAQETVQELSKLLRHVLYDNQQQFVSLDSEMDFLNNYIELMKIRLPESADIQVTNIIPSPNNIQIAPLMFISLIENAFKHGIRTSEKSFIHILLEYRKEDNQLHFRIENSNFPKDQADRSGSGIGLEQVQKRLDLVYPGHYKWEKGVKETENTYYSDIEILLIV